MSRTRPARQRAAVARDGLDMPIRGGGLGGMVSTGAAARLGLELRRMRVQRGLSQRSLVRALGLSAHSNLVQYELGRRIPPGDIVVAFERLFGDTAGTLRRLRAEALTERAGLPVASPETAGEARLAVPAMLPATIADFTGRTPQLMRLAALAGTVASTPPAAVVITAIAGTAGVGKTALAVHFAHRVRDRFPDGQLYVNLRGHAQASPLRPLQVLAGFLRALDVPADRIPTDLDGAAGLYRSLLADRRMLVVLDNARDSTQVRPLLPASSGCLALVTSRDRLTGLVARDGAARLTLDVLPPAESHALLARILGPDRAADPEDVAELAAACAHLPLALRIAAANITNHPRPSVAGYLATLRGDDRLTALDAGDDAAAVRAAFDLSYEALPPDARRMFRLLGLVPGPDVTAEAAAALAGVTPAVALRQLDRLGAAHLLAEHEPGRYACHDLLRLYATERAAVEDGEPTRADAMSRLLEWYLHTADAAADRLYPEALRLPVPAPVTAVTPVAFASAPQALAWFEAERHNLVAAVRHAADQRAYPVAWLLPDTLRFFFLLRMYTADWLTVAVAGLGAAVAGADLRAEALAQLSLANRDHLTGRRRPAITHYGSALSLAERADWLECQAGVLNNLAMVYQRYGQLREAIVHYTRALDLERRSGRVVGQAGCLGNLGTAYRSLGRLPEAAECYAQALVLARRIGSRNREANILFNLGELAYYRGWCDRAFDQLDEALRIQLEIGDRVNQAHTLLTLAAVHRDAGHASEAATAASAALTLASETGERQVEALALTTLGTVCARFADRAEAIGHHERALDLARQITDPYAEVEALLGLAEAYGVDDLDQAAGHASRALRIARRDEYRLLEGRAITCLAGVRLARGQPRRAVRLGWQALMIHRETGFRLGEARTLLLLGSVRGAPARESLEQALALFTDLGAAPDAATTRRLLRAQDGRKPW